MYSGEPVKLDLNNTDLIATSGNTSAAVCNTGTKAFVWGYFNVDNQLFKALKPCSIDINPLRFIKTISVDCNTIALSGVSNENKDGILILGKPGDINLERPFNPASNSAEILNGINLPSVYWDESVQDQTLHNGKLIILKDKKVFIKSLNNDSQIQLHFQGNSIDSMKITKNAAIFKSGQTIYTFLAPPRPYGKTPSLWADFLIGKQKVEPLVSKTLLDVMQTEEPNMIQMENPESITCGWSHFLVAETL
jgi:hypothetical protein